NPRTILNLDIPRIEEGAEANLTLFNTDQTWTFNEENVHSKSANSPYLGSEMIGRAEAVYNKSRFVRNVL
ncbi:MAG: dihydroorotase, partial [Balneolaceae bacterium]|nr:dihydroorotase [Balneolaceae bacterium]